MDVKEIAPEEVKQLFPLCETDDILKGFYVEDDGRVNPVDASVALAKGAKNRGVQYVFGFTGTYKDRTRLSLLGCCVYICLSYECLP